jgi:L-threonylcarbamoyladenylate synthase
VESTVVSLLGATPKILRPGGITLEQLSSALQTEVAIETTAAPEALRSPGQMPSHYAPNLPVRLDAAVAKPGEALLGFGTAPSATRNLSEKGDLEEAAANLFAMLRDLDRPEFSGIAVMPVPERGLGLAINDRLRRAAAPR